MILCALPYNSKPYKHLTVSLLFFAANCLAIFALLKQNLATKGISLNLPVNGACLMSIPIGLLQQGLSVLQQQHYNFTQVPVEESMLL